MMLNHPETIPTAAQFMTESVVTLRPNEDMWNAMRHLTERRISGAPVVDQHHRLVGLLSEKDCVMFIANARYHGIAGGKVEEYMSKEVTSVAPDTGIFAIADLFRKHPYRRLPVATADGHLLGVVSRRDLLRTAQRMWNAKEAADSGYVPEEVKAKAGNTHVLVRPNLHH
jgi:CBS domain-containing protein